MNAKNKSDETLSNEEKRKKIKTVDRCNKVEKKKKVRRIKMYLKDMKSNKKENGGNTRRPGAQLFSTVSSGA